MPSQKNFYSASERYPISDIWHSHTQSTITHSQKYPMHSHSSIKISKLSSLPKDGLAKAISYSITSSFPSSSSSTVLSQVSIGLDLLFSGLQIPLSVLILMRSRFPPRTPTMASMALRSANIWIMMRRGGSSTLQQLSTRLEAIWNPSSMVPQATSWTMIVTHLMTNRMKIGSLNSKLSAGPVAHLARQWIYLRLPTL